MIHSILNASVNEEQGVKFLWALGPEGMTIEFDAGPVFTLQDYKTDPRVLPSGPEFTELSGERGVWVLPAAADAASPAWLVQAEGKLSVTCGETTRVQVDGKSCTLTPFEARPQSGTLGERYTFDFEGGDSLARTLAAFYWGTLLPGVIERTRARDFPVSDGYVLSSLSPYAYAGTYPDVDHEFQIKGRLAMGDTLNEAIVRRMIELQLKLMREDPQGLWRNPCALQPDGNREYHVRRSSRDGRNNAEMFLITGNVEVLESAWLYVAATKDKVWLAQHIPDLEGAASCIEDQIDRQGRLWSDVYFEDQVIQDGRVCDAQAFAAHGFGLLAELEDQLGRSEQAAAYRALRDRLAQALTADLPLGFWDPTRRRFVNWVDRSGDAHDHIHLLSNELPLLFGYARPDQQAAVLQLLNEHLDEFQRFPSFVAADIAGYTEGEIGSGGPYDLCAAGRYWCWDAAFWGWRQDGERLRMQLKQVARQAAKEDFEMGERYDMDHIYYVDGMDWHGAAHYYEYPCVFAWVLVHNYLGIHYALDVDLALKPLLRETGRVELTTPRFALAYQMGPDAFILTNLAPRARTLRVDLSGAYPGVAQWEIETADGKRRTGPQTTLAIGPEETVTFRTV